MGWSADNLFDRSSKFMTGWSGADKIAGVCMLGTFLLGSVPRVFYTTLYIPKACEPWELIDPCFRTVKPPGIYTVCTNT